MPPPTKLDVPLRSNLPSSTRILPTHVLAVFEPERQGQGQPSRSCRATAPVMIPVNADIWNRYFSSSLPRIPDEMHLLPKLTRWGSLRRGRTDSRTSSFSSSSSSASRSSSCSSIRSSVSTRPRPTTVLSLPVHSICIPSARTVPLLLLHVMSIVPENRILPALLPRPVLRELPAPPEMLVDRLMTWLYPDGFQDNPRNECRRTTNGRERQGTLRPRRSLTSTNGRFRQDTLRSRSATPSGRNRQDTIRARDSLLSPTPAPPPSLSPHLSPSRPSLTLTPHASPLSSRASTPDSFRARSTSRSSTRSRVRLPSLSPAPSSPLPSPPPLPPLPALVNPICALADSILASMPDKRLLALAQQNLGLRVNALALGVKDPEATRCIEHAWLVVSEARRRRFGNVSDFGVAKLGGEDGTSEATAGIQIPISVSRLDETPESPT